jgi:DNA-binding NtrC family response regulator
MGSFADNGAIGFARKGLPVCVLAGDPAQSILAKSMIERAGYPADSAEGPDEALENIRLGSCRVVLANFKTPEMDGLTFLGRALQCDPGMYVILASTRYSVDSAIGAIKCGAHDYLRWPLDASRLRRTLDDLAKHADKTPQRVASPGPDWRPLPLDEMRRIHIQRVLEVCNGNRVHAARMLGIGRTSLYRFLKRTHTHTAAA